MTPASLQFAPDAGGATVLHLEGGGFLSLTGMDIKLKTKMGMASDKEKPVQDLMICGEQKLTMQIGESSDDCIVMEAGTEVRSALVVQEADSSPAAVPSGDELLSEQEAADAQAREAENNAVKEDMITKKQESKRKIVDGVISLVTVVGLTALTVATGGLAAPVCHRGRGQGDIRGGRYRRGTGRIQQDECDGCVAAGKLPAGYCFWRQSGRL